jgi:DNA polymerase III subunit epsilon
VSLGRFWRKAAFWLDGKGVSEGRAAGGVSGAVPAGDAPVSDLVLTVFDTEATGPDPFRDDIVSLGAVRILERRIAQDEPFERLVDPGRPIPLSSTRIHGIDDTMVHGKPGIAAVAREFHGFAAGSVLVAYNAPFDLALLARAEVAAGVRFDNAVIDILPLARFLDPQYEDYSLDALATRHAVSLDGRHTALGDAMITARIFLELAEAMADRGIARLDQMIAACGTGAALKRARSGHRVL